MIRFSAVLVVVAIGVLIDGGVTGKLTLVYSAVALSALALVVLAIGVALKRKEIFGDGQLLAPAEVGASTVLSTVGQPSFGQSSFGQPSTGQPAYGLAAFEAAAFTSDAAGGVTGGVTGGSNSEGRREVRERTAFGRSAAGPPTFGQNPARNPWQEPDEVAGRSGTEPATRQVTDSSQPSSWSAPASGQDVRSDRDRDSPPPWMTSGYGGSRGNAGQPPLPGRHSKNAGTDDPWSPPAQPESSSGPESPSPFSSAPRRVPGATLGKEHGAKEHGAKEHGAAPGNWFDQQADSDRRSQSAGAQSAGAQSAGAQSAAGPGTGVDPAPAAVSTQAADSTVQDRPNSGWSGSGWAWSTPSRALTDDPAPSGSPASGSPASGSPASGSPASGSPASAASGDNDDERPTRYSWLEDEETDKHQDSAGLPTATTVSPATTVPSADADADEDANANANADEDAAADTPATQTTAASTSEVSESAAVSDAGDAGNAGVPGAPAEARESLASDETADGAGLVTVLRGVPRYHEANCILIRFMPTDDVQTLTIPEAENLGCTPCTACQSED